MCALVGNLHRYDDLLPLTANRPLSTLPFDGKYRLLDFNLSSIANANIKSLFMVFNEGETQSVFDHIGGGKEWSLDGIQNRFFIHIYQDFIRRADNNSSYYDLVIDYLKKSKSEYAVYMGSKILVNIDLRALLHIHQAHGNEMTVVYKRVPKDLLYKEDIIIKLGEDNLIEKKALVKNAEVQDVANLCTDIFIIKTEKLIEILREKQSENVLGNVESFLRERISKDTYAYEYTGYLNNIYDIPSYYKANMDMLDTQKFNSLLYSSQKVYTKLKNEVPTYYSETSVVNNSQFSTGCMIEGNVEDSIIGRGSDIAEGAKVSGSLIFPSNTIKANAEVSYAILDKNIVVEEGVKIVGTPEKPVVVKKGTHVTADIIGG
ncbi:glucose-1-phosphate adenylyltransferase, GlgD subunit [Enterococcus saccharolyticus subsp. saccharolyticus ATCC 43076]|uniref:Glucose-1-phosphate adenylyltransferase, GlgD subunit n=2 Tax=Enterococcus saccharolyticus TaxID=41997 RepID=S0NSI1_9ENTE|nr:glucose-1-phosphate adenylyltransferase, GlgD subunit [Enterococcus saccharolyticus subsp. saccharolyticus ATCC 43076]EOT80845.1 glucose-1-phosphate adenylyltransferase, GlgD subunit [Enterococcus saccharolyticus subsp. saccharolyticus ATCC 43076]OJG89694.1 glucose-1-phosphate adenylyltransferase, GlgD subunit [Enterococcus saccharolyticus]